MSRSQFLIAWPKRLDHAIQMRPQKFPPQLRFDLAGWCCTPSGILQLKITQNCFFFGIKNAEDVRNPAPLGTIRLRTYEMMQNLSNILCGLVTWLMYGKLQPFNRSWILVQMICRRTSMTSNVWCSSLRIHRTCSPHSQAYLGPPLELLWPLRLNVHCALAVPCFAGQTSWEPSLPEACRIKILNTQSSTSLSPIANETSNHGSWHDSCIFGGLHPIVAWLLYKGAPCLNSENVPREPVLVCGHQLRRNLRVDDAFMPKTRRSNRQFPTMRRH